MSRRTTAKKPFIWLISISLVGVALVISIVAQAVSTAALPAPAAQSLALDPALRSLVVVAPGASVAGLAPGFIQVDLVSGTLPTTLVQGVVRTDVDCTPDMQGVSHCRNLVEYADARVEIRHHHKMMEEPCLSPTEAVNLMSADTYVALQSVSN